MDWLRQKNKNVFGLFKQGLQQKYEGFEESLEEEQALVARLLATPEEKKYIHQADCHEHWRVNAGPGSRQLRDNQSRQNNSIPLSALTYNAPAGYAPLTKW